MGIAQLVESLPSKQTVAGSSPVSHSIIAGLAQLVRVSALQAEGQGFESVNPHHSENIHVISSVTLEAGCG